MKEKVGILTIPRAENYGSVLQAYAMQQFVDDAGYMNEIIDYVSPFLVGRYKLWNISGNGLFEKSKSIIKNVLTFRYKKVKKKKFNEFHKLMRFSKTTLYSVKDIDDENYSHIVCGSDQIWNNRITGNDATFFLNFIANSSKKIAFAVSLGYSDRTSEEDAFYREYTKGFKYIGVREKDDIEYINSIAETGCDVEYIIDPTLLVEQNVWKEMSEGGIKLNISYILVYSFGIDESIIDIARKMSDIKKMKVIVISDEWRRKDHNGFYNMHGVGPLDFLSLIANAEFIITNSFHGTAFSIIFEKNFITVPYKDTGKRMISLLNLLKLDKCIYTENYSENTEINYEEVNVTLKRERIKAKDFLNRALKGE